MELVSICIPTYNGARFLDACLRSALAQTHAHLEVLVVDDCSSDDTLEIAQRHATDPRLRILRNARNQGLVGNWNECVRQARGTWIKFLFQDDILHPECVSEMLAEGLRQQRRLVACDRDFLFAASTPQALQDTYLRNRRTINDFLGPARGASAADYAAMMAGRINVNYVGEPICTLIAADAFKHYGDFDAEFIQLCDVEYWARIASHEGVAFVPRPLASFRVHESATSAINRSAKAFRSTGLERLALLDKALNADIYAQLRELWAASGALALRHKERHDRANEVLEFVHQHRSAPEAANIAQEHGAFVSRHPDCKVSRLSHLRWLSVSLPLRYKYRAGRLVARFFPRSTQSDTRTSR
ncbi:MAG: glycosyltransferase family 2 protein [Moraxellaceae bacterium]|nr:glycosyltransferase family 2 protein [Moraxellaceae bacterium]